MKKIKHVITSTILASALLVGSTPARAGLLLSDFGSGESSCTTTQATKTDNGILVTFTGILVTFTGILVTFADSKSGDCAVIIHD